MNKRLYTPILKAKKDDIYTIIYALNAGIEYSKELLAEHDKNLGRTIHKNKVWAEIIEKDITLMRESLEKLKNNVIYE